jgi:hypothetical protein
MVYVGIITCEQIVFLNRLGYLCLVFFFFFNNEKWIYTIMNNSN